jgi:hypothetical protein
MYLWPVSHCLSVIVVFLGQCDYGLWSLCYIGYFESVVLGTFHLYILCFFTCMFNASRVILPVCWYSYYVLCYYASLWDQRRQGKCCSLCLLVYILCHDIFCLLFVTNVDEVGCPLPLHYLLCLVCNFMSTMAIVCLIDVVYKIVNMVCVSVSTVYCSVS